MTTMKCRNVPTWQGLAGMMRGALLAMSMLVSTAAIAADERP